MKNILPASTFPEVEGKNLDGRKFILPRDFEGRLNIVFVAFQREQQLAVNTWLPMATLLEDIHKGLEYYELPVHSGMNPILRWFLKHAMRMGIRYPGSRNKTINVYTDKDPFCRALGISSEDNIHVLVLDDEARIVWRCEGSCDVEKAEKLSDFIKISQ